MRTPLSIAVSVLALAGASAALAAGTTSRAAPTIGIVACKDAKIVSQGASRYWKCLGQFGLGVPHTSQKVAFLVSNKGIPKGSFVTLNFVDAQTKQPVTSPLRLGPIRYDPGLFAVTFNGPFSTFSMEIDATLKGKTIGSAVFRFV